MWAWSSTVSSRTIRRRLPMDASLTRVNSPSDVEFVGRDLTDSNLSFSALVLNSRFTAQNSVINGINVFPNQTTGGEGQKIGQEVQFDVTFLTPVNLPADHY